MSNILTWLRWRTLSLLLTAALITPNVWAIDTNQIDAGFTGLHNSIQALQDTMAGLRADVDALTAKPVPPVPPVLTSPPVPLLEQYKQNMTLYAAKHSAIIVDPVQAWAIRADACYYDGARIYYQIADYTGDVSWLTAMQGCMVAYRDQYLQPNNWSASGWNIFPHGLLLNFQRAADGLSKTALIGLAQHSSYAASYPLEWSASADVSREVAYNVEAKLLAVSQGATVWGLNEQVEQAFGHIGQWMNRLNGKPIIPIVVNGVPVLNNGNPVLETAYVRPFMAALTTEALIQWAGDDATKQARVLAAVQPLFDALWATCWMEATGTMMYTNVVAPDGSGGQDPSPDLNLLISPAYAWLYAHTHDVKYRDQHDKLFAGGVTGAYLVGAKQFNQSYRWSLQGLAWRG